MEKSSDLPWFQHPPAAGAKIKDIQHQVFVADALGFGLQAQVAVIGGESGQGVDLDQARVAFFIEADVGAGDIERVKQLMRAQGKGFQFLFQFGFDIGGTKITG